MTNEQEQVMKQVISEMHKKWMDRKCEVYDKLIELAELDEEEICDDEQRNADFALETVIRYGSCWDKAVAIRYYSTFVEMKNLLMI